MGEHFVLVNFVRREYLCPFCIGTDSKLQNWSWKRLGWILCCLLGGQWKGGSVELINESDEENDYQEIVETFENITPDMAEMCNDLVESAGTELGRTSFQGCVANRRGKRCSDKDGSLRLRLRLERSGALRRSA